MKMFMAMYRKNIFVLPAKRVLFRYKKTEDAVSKTVSKMVRMIPALRFVSLLFILFDSL